LGLTFFDTGFFPLAGAGAFDLAAGLLVFDFGAVFFSSFFGGDGFGCSFACFFAYFLAFFSNSASFFAFRISTSFFRGDNFCFVY
jgi:hypothetical protein